MRGRLRTRSSPTVPASGLEQALDRAKAEDRLLVLGLHGGRAENGELQAMCEMRGIPFTGSGSASSNLAFDKVAAKRFVAIAGVTAPGGIALDDIDAAFAEYGKLIAKPARDGSSYGLIFVNAKQDLVAVRDAARTEDYLIEPFISGIEATCAVLEQSDGSVFSLPPIEIVPAEGGFDYTAKYLLKSTQEICPGRFSPEISAQIMDQALRAHTALSCSGYSRTDFIVSAKGPIYLETNTLPGLTKASLYPKALQGARHRVRRFPQGSDRPGGTARPAVSGPRRAGPARDWARPLLKSYDCGVKYSAGDRKRTLSAPILPFVYQEVRRLTLAAHVALGCRGR